VLSTPWHTSVRDGAGFWQQTPARETVVQMPWRTQNSSPLSNTAFTLFEKACGELDEGFNPFGKAKGLARVRDAMQETRFWKRPTGSIPKSGYFHASGTVRADADDRYAPDDGAPQDRSVPRQHGLEPGTLLAFGYTPCRINHSDRVYPVGWYKAYDSDAGMTMQTGPGSNDVTLDGDRRGLCGHHSLSPDVKRCLHRRSLSIPAGPRLPACSEGRTCPYWNTSPGPGADPAQPPPICPTRLMIATKHRNEKVERGGEGARPRRR